MTDFSSVNICLFGLNRSLSITIHSLKKYLLDPLEEQGCKISVFGAFCQVDKFTNTRSGETGLTSESGEESLISFAKIKYIDQGAIDDLIRWDLVFSYGDLYDQINSYDDLSIKNSTTKNIFRSMFALKSSFGLIPADLLDRPTIFVRPDLEILSGFDFNLYNSLVCKKSIVKASGESDGVALFPSWHSWDGLNDRFAICSSGNASISYANRFDYLQSYIELSRHPLHPETFLYQVMHASRVEVLPIISTRMARIRANGEPQDEDFSKGSKSVDLQSETLATLHLNLGELRKQLEAKGEAQGEAQQQVEELKQQLEEKGGELQKIIGERDARAQEKGEVQEENELVLLQLHQVQEELEHLFLSNGELQKVVQQQGEMLTTYATQEKRFQHLIHKVLHAANKNEQSKRYLISTEL